MDVSLLSKGGRYEVSPRPSIGTKSTSSTNRVPAPTGSNVHPKAAASTCAASITRSNGAAFPDQTAAFLPRRATIELLHRTDRVAISLGPVER